jgi:hypothetical protein
MLSGNIVQDLKIILNGVNYKLPPLNLSILQFNEDNISTRIALGVIKPPVFTTALQRAF